MTDGALPRGRGTTTSVADAPAGGPGRRTAGTVA